MAQLSDDCFAFGGKLTDLHQAVAHLRNHAIQLTGEEPVALAELSGRVLSQDVIASRSVPPFNNSAVDGYAFIHGQGPTLTLGEHVPAGGEVPNRLAANGVARVLTGAPIPPNANTVIMDEDATLADDGQTVIISTELRAGSNWRPKGEDIRAGSILYPAGTILSGLDLARLAAGGVERAWVRPKLRVHVLSSGDELVNGQIADANRWLLKAIFEGSRFDLTFGGVVSDDLSQSKSALCAIDADLILTSGGVSVGERDYLRAAIEALGSIEFWRVGIKPGRPVAFGSIGRTPILGLPGNPVACFVTAIYLGRAFADACLGCSAAVPTFAVRINSDLKKKPDRTEFVRVCLTQQDDLIPLATPYPVSGAGVISSLSSADGLVILPAAQTRVSAGDLVQFVPLRGLMS